MVLQKCCAGISLIFTLFWTSGSENVEKLCIIKFEGIIVYLIHNIILKGAIQIHVATDNVNLTINVGEWVGCDITLWQGQG